MISGQVLEGQTGRVISGITVRAFAREAQDGDLSLSPAGREGRTDAKGRYEISGLAPGEYLVAAEGDVGVQIGPIGKRPAAGRQIRGMYYQDARVPYLAKTVVVWGGADVVGIDFRLTPEETFYARGRVEGRAEAVTVYVGNEPKWRDDLFRGKAVRLRSGPFEIGPLMPGRYWLTAQSGERGQTGSRLGFLRFEINGEDTELAGVVMAPSFPLTVRIRADGKGGLPMRGGPSMEVALRPLMADPLAKTSGLLKAVLASAGRGVVERVTAEPYQVSVFGLPRDFVVRTMACDGGVLADPIVDFSRTSCGHLDVVVGPVNDSLTFRATEFGLPVNGAMVMMAPDWMVRGQAGYSPMQWTVRADGVAEGRGIVPGLYRAIALPPGSLWGRAVHMIYAGQGEKVEVGDGSARTVVLEVKR